MGDKHLRHSLTSHVACCLCVSESLSDGTGSRGCRQAALEATSAQTAQPRWEQEAGRKGAGAGKRRRSDRHSKTNLRQIAQQGGRVSGFQREELVLHLRAQVRAPQADSKAPRLRGARGQNDASVRWGDDVARGARSRFGAYPGGPCSGRTDARKRGSSVGKHGARHGRRGSGLHGGTTRRCNAPASRHTQAQRQH